MANTLIGRIARRAKQIRKAKPTIDWQTAIKKASLELKGTVRPAVKKVTRRKTTTRTAPIKKRKTVSGMATIGRVRKAAPRKKVTVSSTITRAKKMLLEEIGKLEAKKFATRLKRDQKKVGKKILEKKQLYRKLK